MKYTKRLIALLLALCLFTLLAACKKDPAVTESTGPVPENVKTSDRAAITEADLVGSWTGIVRENEVGLEIKDDGTMIKTVKGYPFNFTWSYRDGCLYQKDASDPNSDETAATGKVIARTATELYLCNIGDDDHGFVLHKANTAYAKREPTAEEAKLVGVWTANDGTRTVTLDLISDGTCAVVMESGEEVAKYESIWIVEAGSLYVVDKNAGDDWIKYVLSDVSDKGFTAADDTGALSFVPMS